MDAIVSYLLVAIVSNFFLGVKTCMSFSLYNYTLFIQSCLWENLVILYAL